MRSTIRHIASLLFSILLIVILPGLGNAQLSPSAYDYPHHHLEWYTLESSHFLVHFQEGNSRSAQVVSRIAEEIYPHITGLYGVEPETQTSIVLNDREDYANGAAYFFDNQIDIWIPALASPLRGTHNWFRDVVSHEFTHIVQLQASMKRNPDLPAIYFQWLSYEDVRRPDVLYGYPKGLITYPFSSIGVPGWFAEGVAQYQRTGWTYDIWDSHRDMILRTAVLNDSYLSFDAMAIFSSKTSLEREQVYNQGFAFSSYLAQQYGESVFREISEALSQTGVHEIDRAIEMATGESGEMLFNSWIEDRESYYKTAVESINSEESELIEPAGFYNFYPTYSPDGSKIAYLSNKLITESTVSLYVKDTSATGNQVAELDLGPLAGMEEETAMSCGFGQKPLITRIRSAFSFSPGGSKLIFTRADLNKFGERYNDLFIYDFESEETDVLTQNGRLHDPAWSPGGEQIAAVQVRQGTANLVLVDPDDGSIEPLTEFSDGEQIYTPGWHPDGATLYFSYAEDHGRSIRRVNLQGRQVETVLKKPMFDFRDPFVDQSGQYLYYSGDPDGIFNIYRIPLEAPESPEQLTSVTGGAFMPTLSAENELTYAEYRKGGYKIVSKALPEFPGNTVWGSYQPPAQDISMPGTAGSYPDILNFDDSDLDPLDASTIAHADTGRVSLQVPTANGQNQRQLYRYDQEFTSFNFYPVIRFDNYSKINGSNSSLLRAGDIGGLGENLLRDLKLGTYFASREVTNRLSIFGGALIGIGSRDAEGIGGFFSPGRLTDLDRDLFLITEYQGLSFIKKRWSPTLSVELYNMRRNVDGGLSVEEFPCTSCMPDTTSVDIAYNIWEIDLFLRSKINAYSMVELGLGYTPYRVQTDAFYSRELQQLVPSSSTEYYRGTMFTAAYVYEGFLSYPHSDTAPLGLRTSLRYNYRPSELLDNFEIDDGVLSPVYRSSQNHSVELSSRYGFRLGQRSTGQVYSRFFSYFNNPDDSFYLDYIGGFTGMRSYPYFALSGNTTAFSQFSYIFPVFTDINEQMGRHTFDKLYLRLFGEVGNGWNGPEGTGNNLKTGIGAELRFSFNSYYLYPLKFFISGAYGFNQFHVNLSDEFITGSGSNRVQYGKEPLIHFGLTFDFEVLNR